MAVFPEMPPALRKAFPNDFWNWYQALKTYLLENENGMDQLSGYRISDMDTSADPNYFGFEDKTGNWYIMKYALGANTFRYVKGSSDYTTNWTGRAGLTYDYFETVF